MLTAFSDNAPSITVEHVQSARREAEFNSVLAATTPRLPNAADTTASLTTQPEAQAPAPAPAPPLPLGPSPSPHADAPPAWTPDAHEKPAERVEPILREELDAWSAAASDLLKARQRAREGAVEPPGRVQDYVPPAASEPPAPLPFPVPAHAAAPLPAEPRREESNITALPPRLREKLEAELADEDRHGGALPWMIGVAAVAVLLMAVVLAQRFGAIDLPLLRGLASPAAADSAHAAPAPPAPPAAAAAAKDSATTAMPQAATPGTAASAQTALNHEPTPPTSAETTPAPQSAPVTPPAPPKHASTPIYGISAGNYLDEDRAGQESARLADLSALPGRVVRYNDAGTTMFRVVLGNFSDEASAERAADRLLTRPGVREARVIVIGRMPAR